MRQDAEASPGAVTRLDQGPGWTLDVVRPRTEGDIVRPRTDGDAARPRTEGDAAHPRTGDHIVPPRTAGGMAVGAASEPVP